ncbi:MAG: GNAT family N-acetyltransferase [Acidimicrobiales bacterium]
MIRPATADDVGAIKAIAIGTGLFDAEGWAEVEAILRDSVGGDLVDHSWIVLESDGGEGVGGAAYFAPEPSAHRIWNLYFLGVRPDRQGEGLGGALVGDIENRLRERGERVLLIETSGLEGFEATRDFYRRQGYDEEARIRDFYGPGDDKVVFWKALTRDTPGG